MPSVYYAVCPGTGGTDDKKTGSPTITISSGVATLSVAQTGNIGQGFRITYDTSKVCFISKVNSSTSFDVVTATGGTPSDEASAVTVNSITADYASLSAAEAGASDANHLNTSDLETATITLNLMCYAGASADTTAFVIDGYTTTPTYCINIIVSNGGTQSIATNRHQGAWSSSCYYLQAAPSTGNGCIKFQDPDIHLIGLQIDKTNNVGDTACLYYGPSNGAYTVDRCILRSSYGTLSNQYQSGIETYGSGISTLDVTNTIIYGFAGSTTPMGGTDLSSSGFTVTLYNCTIFSCRDGVNRSGGTVSATNCAVFSNTDDFNGTITVTYCASDDADGTNAIDLNENASGEWAACFTDYSNGDFSVKDTDSHLYDAGTDLSAYFTTDIIGTTRSTWDIGAFEYVSENTWNGITPAKWNGVDWGNLKWNGM